jgi:hypothetical protein
MRRGYGGAVRYAEFIGEAIYAVPAVPMRVRVSKPIPNTVVGQFEFP